MTNIEKFAEVFGFTPMDTCIAPFEECDKHKYCDNDHEQCPFNNWWYEEFIGGNTNETTTEDKKS